MKHITPFKLFESNSESELRLPAVPKRVKEVKQYLSDIFQELIDNGLTVTVLIENSLFFISVFYSDHRIYDSDAIKDYIESATDYMDSIGYIILRINSDKEKGIQIDDMPEKIKWLAVSFTKDTTKNDRNSV